MASRCAWLGACASEGAATDIVASESHEASFIARFNVLFIGQSFFRLGKPSLRPQQKISAVKIPTARIIFAFRFHCKWIVAIFMGWRRTFFSE
jgi:hypothetical protein